MAGIVDALDRARLVTLVGAPGCGKTRLAAECSPQLASRSDREVWWVELAPVAAPMIAAAVVSAAGLVEEAGRSVEETLVDALAPKGPLLIVLDNCEHVLEPVAGLVHRLLAGCPDLRIMATSRAPLGVPGEQLWNVPQLDLASARDLFVDRATLAFGDLEHQRADDGVVEAICSRVDRVPLAVELAAAWVRTLSLAQICERLAEPSSLLEGHGRGRPARHATMTATVDWSYRLLPAEAQRLFDRLSVFVAGFDLAAAQAVAAPSDGDALDGLVALVDHSLILTDRSQPGRVRYRMLEPVRQCAAARLLASGHHDAVRRRQAEHYLRLFSGADQDILMSMEPAVMRAIMQEENNVLAVLEWARSQPSDLGLRLCDALAAFWMTRGRVEQGRALLAERLATDVADPRLRTNGLIWAAGLARRGGEHAKAHQLLDDALAHAREVDDAWGTAAVLAQRGQVLFSQGDAPAAIAACRESLAVSRAAGEELLWARIYLAWAYYVAGDVAAGDEEAHGALATVGPGRDQHVAAAYFALQYGAFLRGDPVRQRSHLLAALEAMEDGGPLERSDWLGCAAAMAASEGRPRTALRVLGGSSALARRRGIRSPEAVAAPIVELFTKVWDEVGRSRADRLYAQGEDMTWDQLVAAIRVEPDDDRSPLTPRESEIASLVAEGLNNVDIAERLFVSRRTVESHLDHIRRKLGFSNRNQIIAWVLQESPR